jgi:N-glycosylase/DNA lyase
MSTAGKRYRELDILHIDFLHRSELIHARLAEFSQVPAGDYFYELAYCLLTPQSSAVHAGKVVLALQKISFRERGGDPTALLRQKDQYIRFHNTKARRLLAIRDLYPLVEKELLHSRDTPDFARRDASRLREWLVTNVKGLGWKEASHFLRNIGYRDLAILDRHILKNLRRHGVLRSLPQSLTAKRYLAIEQAFALFSATIGITMDELDLLFWSRETGEIRK